MKPAFGGVILTLKPIIKIKGQPSLGNQDIDVYNPFWGFLVSLKMIEKGIQVGLVVFKDWSYFNKSKIKSQK